MKRFNFIYENVIKSIIREGGNAFDDVERIKLKYINSTVNDFKKNIIDEFFNEDVGDNLFLLGSTGKKPDSGDIDICLNANVLNEDVLVSLMKLDELCAEKGFKSYINTINFKMLHISYPQKGIKKNVQIDLLLSKYPDFTKFFMFSPTPSESRYKGAHRNALFHAILESSSIQYTEYDDNKEPIKWNQIDIDDEGIHKMYKTLVDSKGNRLYYKNTNEYLEFNYAKIDRKIPMTHNVNDAIELMFGQNYAKTDLISFEQIFNIILNDKDFKYHDRNNDILARAAIALKDAEKRLEFPKELEPYL